MSSVASRGGRGRWIVVGMLAGLGALGYCAHQQAGVLAQRTLNVVFSNADTEAHGVWFAWNGDIVASDVVLYLDGPTLPASAAEPDATDPGAAPASATAVAAPSDSNTLRFEHMRLRTPGGWTFFLRHLVDRQLNAADVDSLRVTFEGFDSQAGMEPTLGALGPIGALSASPFETEGCQRHAYFVRNELTEMGLTPGATTLEIDVREADSRLKTRIVLDTPGVSRAQYDREETLAKSASLLRLPETATATHSERWDISDQGFVRARNAFCAKQDGVDPQTFVARHVASVQRLLEARGLVPDAQTLAAYADFAEKGGQLAFGGSYASPLHSSERAEVHRNGTAWLRMQARLEHGSRSGDVQWHGTKPRPLDVQGGSTFAAMTKENGGIPPAMGAVDQVATATVDVPVVAVPVANLVAADAATAPASAPSAAPQRPQYASSFATPQMAPPGGRLSWDDLPKYQGRMVQVYTMHAEPRTAMLVSADGREARVRARMDGGHADYRISRESFLRALLIQ
jgi:hypothetical protein